MINPIQNIQISTEFEQLNVNRRYNNTLNISNDNYWIPALYFGAGYRNGNATFGVRYDALYNASKSFIKLSSYFVLMIFEFKTSKTIFSIDASSFFM